MNYGVLAKAKKIQFMMRHTGVKVAERSGASKLH